MFVSGPVGTRTTGSIRLEQGRPQESDGALGARLARRLWQLGAVQAGAAVDRGGDLQPTQQGPVRARGDRDIGPSEQRQDPQCIAGRGCQLGVACHGRDAEQLELGTGQRDDDREGVVMARIAVQDDRDRRHRRSMRYGSAMR